jgi:transposase
VENSGSWGKGLAQFPLAQGEGTVCEVSPQRTAQYRRRGRSQDKTDATDALAIARLLLAEGEQLPRVQADDASTELRLLSDHRDNLLAERTRPINQLHGQLLQLDPTYQEASGPLAEPAGIAYCRALTVERPSPLAQTRLLIVRQLAEQARQLEATIAQTTALSRERVRATRTPLLAVCGVGDIIAARILGELV